MGRNNNDFHTGKMLAMYHATDVENVKDIMSGGLGRHENDEVWLAHSPTAARYGAMMDIFPTEHKVLKVSVAADKLESDNTGRYKYKKYTGIIPPNNLTVMDDK